MEFGSNGLTLVCCDVKGEALRTPCMNDVNEMTVMIGAQPCNITVITDTQLQCKPPHDQPPGYSNHLPRVTVSLLE